MMRGYRMTAPVLPGAWIVELSVAGDDYLDRRCWTDWLRENVQGACLIVEREGTVVEQNFHFADFGEALRFMLAHGARTISPMTGVVAWTVIKRDRREYSPVVFNRDWAVSSEKS